MLFPVRIRLPWRTSPRIFPSLYANTILRILGRERLDERIKAFKGKDPEANMTQQDFKSRTGEGVEDVLMMPLGGYGAYGMGSFNSFYNSYINRAFESEY